MKQKQLIISLIVIACLVAAFLVGKSFFASDMVEKIVTMALDNSDSIESWSSKSIAYDDTSNTLFIEELKIIAKNGMTIDFGDLEAAGINVGDKTIDSVVANNIVSSMPSYRASCNIANISFSGIDASQVQDAEAFIAGLASYPYTYNENSYAVLQGYSVDRLNCTVDTIDFTMGHMKSVGEVYIGKLAAASEGRVTGITANAGGLFNFEIPEMVVRTAYDEAEQLLSVKYDEFEVLNYLTLEMEFAFADFDPAKINAMVANKEDFAAMDSFSFAKVDLKMADRGIVDTIYTIAGLQLGMSTEELKRYLISNFETSGGMQGMQNATALNAAILQLLNDPRALHFTMNPAEPLPISSLTTMADESDDSYLEELNMTISVNNGPAVSVY